MKRTILIFALFTCIVVAGYTFHSAWQLHEPAQPQQQAVATQPVIDGSDARRTFVDLDVFAQKRPQKEGTREIVQMVPIAFDAIVREAPKEISTSYLQEAFGVLGLHPAPIVRQRMFVETAKGHVMPVYVWDAVAADFAITQTPQRMRGFHVYTYGKGPAIVVDGAHKTDEK